MGASTTVRAGTGTERATPRHGGDGGVEARIDAPPHRPQFAGRCVCVVCDPPPAWGSGESAHDRASQSGQRGEQREQVPQGDPSSGRSGPGVSTASHGAPSSGTPDAAASEGETSGAQPGNLSGLSGHPAGDSVPACADPAPTYGWSLDEERFDPNLSGPAYTTREAAIAAAVGAADEPELVRRVWTARRDAVDVASLVFIDVHDALNDVYETACDLVGDEAVSDSWPTGTPAEMAALQQELEQCVVRWIERTCPPKFWLAADVVEHHLVPPPGGEPDPEPSRPETDPSRCGECGDGTCGGCDREQPGPPSAAAGAPAAAPCGPEGSHAATCLVTVHQLDEGEAQVLSLCTCAWMRVRRSA